MRPRVYSGTTGEYLEHGRRYTGDAGVSGDHAVKGTMTLKARLYKGSLPFKMIGVAFETLTQEARHLEKGLG